MVHSKDRWSGPVSRRGITLTEVVIVVVIVGLLSALAVPKFTTSMGESQLEADSNRLFTDLQWAKTQAPSQSSDINRSGTRMFVVFDTARKSWSIYLDKNGDSTFTANQDSLVKRDSFAGTTRFGFASNFTRPSVSAPLGSGTAPQTGFGQASTVADNCLDGKIYPAPTPAANTWAWSGGGNLAGKITVCGGATGAMSNGVLYLTSTRSKTKAYAIVYNSLTNGAASLGLRRYLWNGTAWSKL
jgi:prepilin-type N-terminal cleavage/methylation domain-containing protein